MKKILSILIAIMMSVLSAYAQIDITQFNKVGPEAVSALLGNPPEQWRDDVYPDCLILGDEEYPYNIEDSRIRAINNYIQSASTLSNPSILNYAHNYMVIVNESLIPTESKRFINGGVSLASSSLILWESEDD